MLRSKEAKKAHIHNDDGPKAKRAQIHNDDESQQNYVDITETSYLMYVYK